MGDLFVNVLNILLLIVLGILIMYYGEEIGMKDIFYMYSESWDLVGFNYKVYCVYENNIGGL